MVMDAYYLNSFYQKLFKADKTVIIDDIEDIELLEEKVWQNIVEEVYSLGPDSVFEVNCGLGQNLVNITKVVGCPANGCQNARIFRSYGQKLFGLKEHNVEIQEAEFMSDKLQLNLMYELVLFVNHDIVEKDVIEKMYEVARKYVLIVGNVNGILENSVKELGYDYTVNKETGSLLIKVGEKVESEQEESDGSGREIYDWEGNLLEPEE